MSRPVATRPITFGLQLIFTLLELARQPEIQRRLREEVTEMYEAARARGDEDLTPGDIDNLPFTNAVVKVRLSLHLCQQTLTDK